ncbi:hypothetical protein NFI96_007535 [Prochilodus magdalenae]|nr:hypothetical protein NFI96_007535 [Prochilodus magdalenae]
MITDWQVFREAAECEGELDLEDYTSAVLRYISKCVEDVTTIKTVTCYPNQKPWLNAKSYAEQPTTSPDTGVTGAEKGEARRRSNTDRPPIPSLFLSNIRSLDNKLDLLRLRMSVSGEMRNCTVICLTETWLNDSMPDSAFQLAGRQLFLADRNQLSGKARGGCLCVYINEDVISFREDPAFFNKIMPDHILQKSQHHGYVGEGSGVVIKLTQLLKTGLWRSWLINREAATYSTTTDLEEYTSSVTSYISKCIDNMTVSKTIITCPNQKPWMTAEVRALLKARDSVFKAGDKAALRKARAKLSRGIREAKRAHGQSIHSHFRDSGDTRRMWQGIQAIINYRTAPPACDSDASLPDALNHFYARFETQNSMTARKTTPPPDDQVLCLTAADVRKTLCRVNPRKAAGPDNIPGRVLKECADQLTDVFTDIFDISLSSATVPTCLKATTIIPVLKKSSVSCLKHHHAEHWGPTGLCAQSFVHLADS